MFILAQIIGAIILVCVVVALQQKSKTKVLMGYMIANVLFIIQFLLLEAYVGAIIYVVNTIRTIVFYYFKKKDMKPSVWVLIIFMIACIISGIVAWENIYSIIPVVAAIMYTYSMWQDNLKVFRIMAVIALIGWVTYNFVSMAYTGALTEIIHLTSAIVAIVRYDILKQKSEEITEAVKEN